VSRLRGRTALVTGASRGIGAAVAGLLVEEGARVIRVARTLTRQSRGPVEDIPCDLTDGAQLGRLAAGLIDAGGPPDLVVSNAGAFLLKSLETTDDIELDRQLAVNLRAPFALARAFLPAMGRRGAGSFITIGSVADHVGYPENAAYAASKYGLRGLHETLLEEYRGSGVRLTLVSPGPTDTSVWDPVDPDRREGFIPRAGMLRPSDVAEAVLFVATRPAHVLIDWLRLGPTGKNKASAADERR
jgi:NAD(P)-dependent dehydrogenase (short-subunit alcohol dehydrogenase family)